MASAVEGCPPSKPGKFTRDRMQPTAEGVGVGSVLEQVGNEP